MLAAQQLSGTSTQMRCCHLLHVSVQLQNQIVKLHEHGRGACMEDEKPPLMDQEHRYGQEAHYTRFI